MAVTFQSDDWAFFKREMEDMLAKHRQSLEQDQTHEETIQARAKVQILKTLLDMPKRLAQFPLKQG